MRASGRAPPGCPAKKIEIPLDHASKPVGFGDGQTKAVLVKGTRRGISEFAERLRSIAEAQWLLPDQRLQRPDYDDVPGIIALTNTQKNIAVEKARVALGHQS